MSDIRFRIAAKTDVGLERTNNEDNFQVSANLEEVPMKWVNNQEYSLGAKGALLVVADGMGGMNAGEVASEIAVNTVKELFAPDQITDEVVKNRFTIEKFMKGVIVEADKRIKEFAKSNPESQGMGTTIVVAWLFDGHLYVSWCGDSRAYIYNPNVGLFQISKDHSYVQVLVDKGKISKEDAFDFPDSNIVTRSLTDSTTKAVPDCLLMPQPLCNGDIILLCSDGLNGMIRDQEIEAIMSQHQDNMTECVDALIQAALDAAGADNCTVALCQILSGGEQSKPDRIPKYSVSANDTETKEKLKAKTKKGGLWILGILLLVVIFGGCWWYFSQHQPIEIATQQANDSIQRDTIKQEKQDTATNEAIPNEEREPDSEDPERNIPKKEQKSNDIKNGKITGAEVEGIQLTPISNEDDESLSPSDVNKNIATKETVKSGIKKSKKKGNKKGKSKR